MELAEPAPLGTENLKGQAQVGWTLTGLCQTQILKHAWEEWNEAWKVALTGALWVCGPHGCPYLPGKWTGCCTWGWPYLPARVQKTLPIRPTNWEACKSGHWVKHTPCCYYTLAIFFSPQAASIVTETEITALASHTARVLNATHDSSSLLNEEVCLLGKVALQNHAALDMLTASQVEYVP